MSEIKVSKLCKNFGKNSALTDVSLTLRENCIYGLLGRNGAGKSTLLNILSGRMFPTSGEVTVDGEPLTGNDNALGKIFMMGEQLVFIPSLKVKKMFEVTADFYPDYDMEYAMKLAGNYGLDCKKHIHKLSTGYKTIAKIINALACGAPVVFFDEPVLGLDANHRDMFYRNVIERYTEHPATYVISTHLIEEASSFIERAIIIRESKLIMEEDTEIIRGMGYTVSGKAGDVDSYLSSLGGSSEILRTEVIGGLKTVSIKGQPAGNTQGLEITPLSLQNMFVCLTNENIGKE
ncbi:MAG: ABC transporter ATP-binding protein [Oscillospiraceae bacterium]|nr:ABC transporter ATP-binding protein [Oscillospiraceae bacterium]